MMRRWGGVEGGAIGGGAVVGEGEVNKKGAILLMFGTSRFHGDCSHMGI